MQLAWRGLQPLGNSGCIIWTLFLMDSIRMKLLITAIQEWQRSPPSSTVPSLPTGFRGCGAVGAGDELAQLQASHHVLRLITTQLESWHSGEQRHPSARATVFSSSSRRCPFWDLPVRRQFADLWLWRWEPAWHSLWPVWDCWYRNNSGSRWLP